MELLRALLGSSGLGGLLQRDWPWSVVHAPNVGGLDHPRWRRLAALEFDDLARRHRGPICCTREDADGRYREWLVDSSEALHQLDRGAAICLSGCDAIEPELRRWTSEIVSVLGVAKSRSRGSAYFSRAGHGLPPHWDDREILVLQIRGTKRWRVTPNRAAPFPTCGYPFAPGDRRGEVELPLYAKPDRQVDLADDRRELDLTPGSLLFLPRGTWHETRAIRDSFSITVGLDLPTGLEVLLTALRLRLLSEEQWRRPLPVGPTADNSDRLAAALGDLLDGLRWPMLEVDELSRLTHE